MLMQQTTMRNLRIISLHTSTRQPLSSSLKSIIGRRRLHTRPLSSAAAALCHPEDHHYFLSFDQPATGGSTGRNPPIFVAATRQHVGKTTTALAVMSGLQKRFDKVGFIKPVGQVCLTVQDEFGHDVEVDKDVAVVRNHFKLDHCPVRHMSPVQIPRGYTKDFIDGHISSEVQHADIIESFQIVDDLSDVVLCEGTGHCKFCKFYD
jgi:hypothetical protein